MRAIVSGIAVLLLLSLSPRSTFAHGGAYRGPSGEVPPGQRDPKDPPPPGPPPPIPIPPDAPPPPPEYSDGHGPGGGPLRRVTSVMTFTNWVFWWAYNKDAILVSRSGTKPGRVSEAHREKAVTTLEQVVANRELHPDIRAGAVIALARAEPTLERVAEFLALTPRETSEEKIVRESAILALGLTGIVDPQVRGALLDVVRDGKDDVRARCFAMVALGLLRDDHDHVLKELEARVAADERTLDIPACALLALGLVGSEKSVPKLVGWIESGRVGAKRLRDFEESWAVAALGKSGHPDALDAIWKGQQMKGRYARRSAAIALGRVVPATTGETPMVSVRALARFWKSEKDLTAKNLAMISLGRIASDPRIPSGSREFVTNILARAYSDSHPITERPFVALAMGIADLDGKARTRMTELLRPAIAARKGNKVALGANAVALGLLRDTESVEILTKILADRVEVRHLRQAAATGLGLIGGEKANAAILASLADREDRVLRVNTGMSAGLLAPPGASGSLLKLLDDLKASQFVLGSAALALGWVGDDAAIERMVAILDPEKVNGDYPDLTRAMVTVALGRLLDRREHRSLHRLSEDLNYRAMVPALDEILTIL